MGSTETPYTMTPNIEAWPEVPTKPGDYWWTSGEYVPFVRRVAATAQGRLVVQDDGRFRFASVVGGRWLGPITANDAEELQRLREDAATNDRFFDECAAIMEESGRVRAKNAALMADLERARALLQPLRDEAVTREEIAARNGWTLGDNVPCTTDLGSCRAARDFLSKSGEGEPPRWSLSDKACALADRGDKIAAIKLHRVETGQGLKESKDDVEAYLRGRE